MTKKKLKEAEILAILDEITDEQAENSDCCGDSDAEDDIPVRQILNDSGDPGATRSPRGSGATKDNSQNLDDSGEPGTSRPQRAGSRAKTYAEQEDECHVSDMSSDDYDDDPTFSILHNTSSDESIQGDGVNVDEGRDDDDQPLGSGVNQPSGDNNFDWTKTSAAPQIYLKFYFSEPIYGPKIGIDLKSPLSTFQTFFSATLLAMIVSQTNLYASQKNVDLGLTIEELKAFLGILVIMGFHCLPSLRLYWSTDENFHFSRICRVMTLHRFLKILRFLHLNDNTKMPQKTDPNFDKLFKVRPLLEHFQNVTSSVFQPSRYLSLDESMIKFKGRSSMKQYMPMKPIKRGFKVWVAACAVTGFVLSFEIYTGRTSENPELGLGERVVLKLSILFRGLGYILFYDNFFSSLPLARKLLEERLFSCGTLRSNQKYPKNLMKSDNKMVTGDSDFAQAGDISVTKWRDRGKKSVVVVSTFHDPSKKESVLRTNKEGHRVPVPCPKSIADYNMYMGGVDKFDQLMSAYNVSWKSRRWWVKLFYYFLDMAVVNIFILHKEAGKKYRVKTLSHLKFGSCLANELIGSFTNRKKAGPTAALGRDRKRNTPDGFPTVENSIRLANVGNHMPVQISTYRRCANCSMKAKEKRSNMICSACNVALCKPCFTVFHAKED